MDSFGQEVRLPWVEQRSVTAAVLAAGVGTVSTVIAGVPSIHAREISIMIDPSVNISAVNLRFYGSARQTFVDVAVSGAILAGIDTGIRYGLVATDFIGQAFDIRVTNNAIGAGTCNCWVAARTRGV